MLYQGVSTHGREIVPWFEALDRILSDESFLDTQGTFSSGYLIIFALTFRSRFIICYYVI